MPEHKVPEVLAALISQLRKPGDAPQDQHQASAPPGPAPQIVFQIGQGGIVQFVLGKGVLNSGPDGGIKDA